MVVPAVRIVIHDYYRGAVPSGERLQEVDRLDEECLLVERIGISGMPVLVSRGFEEADGGKISDGGGSEEVQRVVLVVGRPGVADLSQRGGSRVRGIRG